jgi:hypothetical protein
MVLVLSAGWLAVTRAQRAHATLSSRATEVGNRRDSAASMAYSDPVATVQLQNHSVGGVMADLYTCNCGNQKWEISDTVVRCTECSTEYVTRHTPVAEFNHEITQELVEEMEP